MPDSIHVVRVGNALSRQPEPIPARVKDLPAIGGVHVYFLNRPGSRSERQRAKMRLEAAGYEVVSYRPGRGFVEPRFKVKPRPEQPE